MSSPRVLLFTVDRGVATLTLNRPERLNALNLELKACLADAIAEIGGRADIRAVVVTGAGRAFCSGGDVREMDAARTSHEVRQRLLAMHHKVIIPLTRLEKPVIAVVNGAAVGAGFSLALACDFVFAAESASFSMIFTQRGLVPDSGIAYVLPRLIGMARAKELAYTGRRIEAAEACKLGLVLRVESDAGVLERAVEFARSLAAGASVALGLTKRLFGQSLQSTIEEMADYEACVVPLSVATEDHAEGIKAFAEKRAPRFTGR